MTDWTVKESFTELPAVDEISSKTTVYLRKNHRIENGVHYYDERQLTKAEYAVMLLIKENADHAAELENENAELLYELLTGSEYDE